MPAPAQKRVFQLFAGHPALDLVNTLDWRLRESGPEELLVSYEDLLAFSQQSGILSAREARRLQRGGDVGKSGRTLDAVREMREASALVFYALLDARKPPAAALARLDASFKAARAQRALVNTGDGLRWEWLETASELPLWRLALSAEDLLTSDRMEMVRSCASPDCRWLFLDTSKNHSRRWCEMSLCGNRMKARRFRQQQTG